MSSFRQELGWLEDADSEDSKKRAGLEYERLLGWVLNSLDSVKYELIHLFFPLYCLCYIRLISQDAYDEVQAFKNKHRQEHIDRYATECDELSVLANKHKLDSDDFLEQCPFMYCTTYVPFSPINILIFLIYMYIYIAVRSASNLVSK